MLSKLFAALVFITISFPLQAQTNPSLIPNEHQVHCLAEAVYHEARGESLTGQAAVARTVLVRARYPETFGDSVCKVVYQKRQFSWSSTEKLSYSRHEKDPEFLTIKALAFMWMLADETGIPYVPVKFTNVTFFSNTRPMAHNLIYAGRIQHHCFYYNMKYLASTQG